MSFIENADRQMQGPLNQITGPVRPSSGGTKSADDIGKFLIVTIALKCALSRGTNRCFDQPQTSPFSARSKSQGSAAEFCRHNEFLNVFQSTLSAIMFSLFQKVRLLTRSRDLDRITARQFLKTH
jgi:hypothetical protein